MFVALLPAAAAEKVPKADEGSSFLNENETPHPGRLPAATGRGGTIERSSRVPVSSV